MTTRERWPWSYEVASAESTVLGVDVASDLVDRRGEASRISRPEAGRVQRSPRDTGAATTADTTFNSTLHDWDDMPTESRRLAVEGMPAIAEHVELYDSLAWRIDGVLHQAMVGWRAFADRIVIATAVRPLKQRPDRKLRPSGDWRHHKLETFTLRTAPRRRHGTVRAGAPSTSGGAGGPSPRVPCHHARAAETFSYLPAPVRRTVETAVAEPTVWTGAIAQSFDREGYPTAHQISMLRMDADHAVVVHAERLLPPTARYPDVDVAAQALAKTSWSVTQVTYELMDHRASLAGGERGQLEMD